MCTVYRFENIYMHNRDQPDIYDRTIYFGQDTGVENLQYGYND